MFRASFVGLVALLVLADPYLCNALERASCTESGATSPCDEHSGCPADDACCDCVCQGATKSDVCQFDALGVLWNCCFLSGFCAAPEVWPEFSAPPSSCIASGNVGWAMRVQVQSFLA